MRILLHRIKSTPLRSRFYQLANAAIVASVGSHLQVCHVVAHPKSGVSWLRNMIQLYLGGPRYLNDQLVHRKTVIQLHRLYRRMYCNPVVLLRDPRDIFTSFYYHELRGAEPMASPDYTHNQNLPLKDDFAKYLWAKLTYPIHPGFRFCEFVNSWYERSGTCSVRYEDLLSDCGAELTRILEFLGEPVCPERVQEVVDYHSFSNQTLLRYGEERQHGQENISRFERKGVSGDWRNIFNEESCRLIHEYEWDSLQRLGYESDPGWIDRFLESQQVESGRHKNLV